MEVLTLSTRPHTEEPVEEEEGEEPSAPPPPPLPVVVEGRQDADYPPRSLSSSPLYFSNVNTPPMEEEEEEARVLAGRRGDILRDSTATPSDAPFASQVGSSCDEGVLGDRLSEYMVEEFKAYRPSYLQQNVDPALSI